MPGHTHEAAIELLADELDDTMEFVAQIAGIPLPTGHTFTREESNLAVASPVSYRADLVAVNWNPDGRAALAIILELQNSPDPDKPYTWPAYWADTRARHRCPAALVVVTFDDDTTAWARGVGATGEPHAWRPHVIGPRDIPRVTDPLVVRAHPAMALLSALAHARDAEVLQTVLPVVLESDLERDRVRYYFDVIMERGGGFATAILERIMDHRPEFRSKWAIERKEEGRREGLRDGLEEGRRDHARRMLRRTAARRGLTLGPAQDLQIDQCRDLDMLERWIDRADSASTAEDIFRGDA
jgi:hypothetical protein